MQRSDTMAVRREAHSVAMEVRKLGDNSNPASYEVTHFNIYEAAILNEEPSRTDIEVLNHWTRAGQEFRGLEKVTMPTFADQRNLRIKTYVHSVIRTYRATPDEELLHHVATEISQAAKAYALHIGKSDEQAAYFEESNIKQRMKR